MHLHWKEKSLHKAEIEYNENSGYNLGSIQHIALMSITDIH